MGSRRGGPTSSKNKVVYVQLLEEERKERPVPNQLLSAANDKAHRLRTKDDAPVLYLKLPLAPDGFRDIRHGSRTPNEGLPLNVRQPPPRIPPRRPAVSMQADETIDEGFRLLA